MCIDWFSSVCILTSEDCLFKASKSSYLKKMLQCDQFDVILFKSMGKLLLMVS